MRTQQKFKIFPKNWNLGFKVIFAWLSIFCSQLFAQTTNVSLVNTHGFESNSIYPVGNLQAVTDGNATWDPAGSPAQIVSLGSTNGKVLRRIQTGVDNTDVVSFPAVSNGVLNIQFDARASTAPTRTLDVVLLPTSGGSMASMLGWGTVTNKLCYYDGTNWIGIFNLNTNWHHIETIHQMASNKFDLKIDGATIGTNLPWRNTFAAGTSFNRVRIGAIRGTTNTFADIDNLVISAVVTAPPSEDFSLIDLGFSLTNFSFSFQTQSNREYLVESTSTLSPLAWKPLDTLIGNGFLRRYTSNAPTNLSEFYRVAKLAALQPGRNDGYRSIWFTLGQFSEYGDKYSGGLGTYTANHVPIAIYAPAMDKTFFVYGGTIKDDRHLLIMASYYDHVTHQVPRPTIVHDKNGVDDPHDNAAICIDGEGYIWVFVSGRATARPGFKYKSKQPYNVSEFEFIRQDEITYPQPWFIPGFGFLHLFTKYTAGRELYWETSTNGINWSTHKKLAGIGGHYQVSQMRDGKIGTFFNRHPGGNVDKRTDLYYIQTEDSGTTWTTAGGVPVSVPLTTTNNPALVINYSAQSNLVYGMDLNFDTNGNPVMLYITSNDYQPGPNGDPRTWRITRWNGTAWITSTVCTSDHNYDMGSLYIRTNEWLIIGPTQNGPQVYQTGGEMALWKSTNEGATWQMLRQITTNSIYNHSYARRPVHAKDPFFAFWADGNSTNLSPSRLFFGNSDGTQVWQLPYDSSALLNTPQQIPFGN
ncbi:MAG: BNR-4 repeat-containing protein [Verrucomicrobiota bacterium]